MTYDPAPCDKKCCSEHSWIPPVVSDCAHRTSLSSNGYPAGLDCVHRTSLSSRGYPQKSRIVSTVPHSHLMDTQQAWIVPTVPHSHLMDTPRSLRLCPPYLTLISWIPKSRIVPTVPHSHLMDTQQAWIVPTVPHSHLVDTPRSLGLCPPYLALISWIPPAGSDFAHQLVFAAHSS